MRKLCANCQKEFEADRNARYCSKECTHIGRLANKRHRYKKYTRDRGLVCLKCGKTFEVRSRYGNGRALCYECQPELIDDIVIELPLDLQLEKEIHKMMKEK